MNYDDTLILDNKDKLLENSKSETEILEDALVNEQDYSSFERKYSSNMKKNRFVQHLRILMIERDFDVIKLYKNAGLSRSYCYQLLNGERQPSRDAIISIALTLSSDLDELNELLKVAEKQTLYAKNKRDSVIIFSVVNKFSLKETNNLLAEYQHQLL